MFLNYECNTEWGYAKKLNEISSVICILIITLVMTGYDY